jgi:hypothetical protein
MCCSCNLNQVTRAKQLWVTLSGEVQTILQSLNLEERIQVRIGYDETMLVHDRLFSTALVWRGA